MYVIKPALLSNHNNENHLYIYYFLLQLAGYGDLVYLWDEMDCQIKVEDFSSAPLISALLKKTERLLDQVCCLV